MRTLTDVTEIPEEEFAAHPDDVVDRVEAGEDLTIVRDGRPVVDLTRHYRPVSLAEFLTWPKADPKMLDDIRAVLGDETTADFVDPWTRWAR
jgi:antitoxin (DNA-binding transcriptional repressor) of toxin-antitoxin stability system